MARNEFYPDDETPEGQLKSQLRAEQAKVRHLYSIIVRGMVVLKNLIRLGSVVAAYMWLGKNQAFFLAGFILVVGTFQLVIDKTRKVVNPDLKLSEWDVL